MSRVTFLKGEHWWIWRTRPSGRTVYPKSIKVGHPDRGRTFEPVAKAKLSRAVGGGWYCGRCAVYIGSRCMANATEWLKPRRCPNCGAEFDGEVNVEDGIEHRGAGGDVPAHDEVAAAHG